MGDFRRVWTRSNSGGGSGGDRRDSLLGTLLCVCTDCKEMVLQVSDEINELFSEHEIFLSDNNIVSAPGDPCSENSSETTDDTVTVPQPAAQLHQGGNPLETRHWIHCIHIESFPLH